MSGAPPGGGLEPVLPPGEQDVARRGGVVVTVLVEPHCIEQRHLPVRQRV